ncbi:MAG TPA: MalY/PatB family protein [Myxococcota bacterium]|nr:MalY/PatB family protein [Myxococcota bacterium]
MRFDDLDVQELRRRRGEKWQEYPADVLPAWVADMDFPVAEPIARHLAEAVRLHDIGYPLNPTPSALPTVFAKRMQERFGWQVDPRRVLVLSDVVQGIYIALETLCERGAGVVLQPPVYPPFFHAVRETHRRTVLNRLVRGANGYGLDLDGLRRACDAGTRVLLLCNPQNPTGRVFTRAELEGMAQLALERDLLVISDEIQCDLVYPGHRHIPFASLGPEVEARTVTLTSATKGFNIAGLRCAVAAFGSDALLARFKTVPSHVRGGLGTFGLAATEIAWTSCQPWLDDVMAYLDGNRRFVAEFLRERVPEIRHHPGESLYLAWLDCAALELGGAAPFDFFLERARVALSDGRNFGAGGETFARLNFATSRAILREILERMARALGR